jgi:hypothetical protein
LGGGKGKRGKEREGGKRRRRGRMVLDIVLTNHNCLPPPMATLLIEESYYNTQDVFYTQATVSFDLTVNPIIVRRTGQNQKSLYGV